MPATITPHDAPGVVVRRLRQADLARVEDLCQRVSPDILRLRFFTAVPRLTGATLGELTHQRARDEVAVVASDGDRLAGLARYDRTPGTDTAYAWLLVDRDVAAPRLDLELLADLIDEARDAGLRRLVLEVHPLDQRLLTMLAEAPLRTSSHLHCGLVTIAIDVEPALGLTPFRTPF